MKYAELAKNLSRKLGYLQGEAKALMNRRSRNEQRKLF
jgi:hypothetical protein